MSLEIRDIDGFSRERAVYVGIYSGLIIGIGFLINPMFGTGVLAARVVGEALEMGKMARKYDKSRSLSGNKS